MKGKCFCILIFALFVFNNAAFAQYPVDTAALNNCRKQVAEINSMPLCRAYIYSQPNSYHALSTKLSYFNNPRWQPHIYYDAQGRIRKLINNEESGNAVSYYDEEGFLCYTFFMNSWEGYLLSAVIYAHKNNAVSVDVNAYDESGEYYTGNIKYQQYYGALPSKMNDFELKYFLHTDSIKRFYNINLDMPDNCIKVSFTIPKGDSVVYVNNHNVPIYERADIKSKVVKTESFFNQLKILNKDKLQSIANLGANNWYKLEQGGYVFGAFIDAKEHVEPSDWQLLYFGNPDKPTKVDERKLAETRKAVSDIEKLTLTKKCDNNSQCFFTDAQNRIRKLVATSNVEDNSYQLTSYYNELGQLLNLECDNWYYDTVYIYDTNGLSLYDVKDAQESGTMFFNKDKLVYQTYKESLFMNNAPIHYSGVGEQALLKIGKIDISFFMSADAVARRLKFDALTQSFY